MPKMGLNFRVKLGLCPSSTGFVYVKSVPDTAWLSDCGAIQRRFTEKRLRKSANLTKFGDVLQYFKGWPCPSRPLTLFRVDYFCYFSPRADNQLLHGLLVLRARRVSVLV